MKVLFSGPYLDSSGFASASRSILKSLTNDKRIKVAARPIRYDQPDEIYDFKFNSNVIEAHNADLLDIDIFIQCTTCNIEATPKPGIINILYTFFETNFISIEWAQKAMLFDYIMVPSKYNITTLLKSGIPAHKILLCPVPTDIDDYDKSIKPWDIKNRGDRTVFYNINQFSPKKNIEGIIRAYFAEFIDTPDEVLLFLKSYISMSNRDNNLERQHLTNIINSIKQKCRFGKTPPIQLEVGVLSMDQIKSIHLAGDCYINGSRAEGWGLGPIDAMGFGKPVITNNYGGLTDFCTHGNSIIYGGAESYYYDFAHPDPGLYHGKHIWFEPSLVEMSSAMRRVHRGIRNKETWINNIVESAKSLVDSMDYRLVSTALVDALLKIKNGTL